MHYLVTIGYETLQENGNTKTQKVKYIFEAESVEEVTIVAAKYASGDTRDSELLAISKMAVECIVDKNTNPEYYKA